MAAPYNPPVKGEEFIFYVALKSRSTGQFKVNPTIAAGDFQVKKDAGAPANLGTLPAVDSATEIWVKVTLTATEMNADNVMIQAIDAAGAEWDDVAISIPTTA